MESLPSQPLTIDYPTMLITGRLTAIRSSFRAKIFTAFTLLSALVFIMLSTLYLTSEIREKKAYLSANLKLVSQQLVESIRLPLYAENQIMLRQIADNTLLLPETKAVVISAADGRLLVDLRAPDHPGPEAVLTETALVFSSPLVTTVENALSGIADTGPSLIGSVRLERSTTDLSRQIRQLVLYSAISALLSWLVVISVFYLMLRTFTASFNELMLGLKRMQKGDYSSRICIEALDEPGQAAQAANELSDRLLQRTEENLRLTQNLHATNRSLEIEIAERIQAEQQLRESEQSLKHLLNVIPVGVTWHDSDGNLEYVNRFFSDLFGYGREDFATVEKMFMRLLPDPEYRKQVAGKVLTATGETGKHDETNSLSEARVSCKDRTIRHVIINKTRERNRTILLFVDITERELLQEQLLRTQKLESIGILAGGIAHNFNNALTGVMGFINLAAKQLETSSKAVPMLERAEKATRRASAMAKQLLTFARGGSPVKKALSLSKLVDESVSMALNDTNVRTMTSIPADVHFIKGDEDQLCQVFNNLAINAVHAMPEGGVLTIRAENVLPEPGQANSGNSSKYVRVSVSDTGHGIPEANMTKIFEPYFTTNPSNTGLGLASVFSIVHKHGGQITVESTVGVGTTFSLLLPSTDDAPDQQESAVRSLRTHTQGNASVLVMDDEETIRDLAQHTLEFLGYQATVCNNGEEAVEAYRAAYESGRPFMAAILDLTINCGMGGLEASRQILGFDASARLIVSSGYSFDPVLSDYKSYGFCAAVAKPYQADDLGLKLDLITPLTAETVCN